jgi:hypothetical protein
MDQSKKIGKAQEILNVFPKNFLPREARVM